MTARRHILPPSTTALERTIDQATPAWDTMADAFPLPRNGTPSAVLPWVAAELQLTTFARYHATTQALIDAGRAWLLVRGTAAAVLLALAWVGFGAARVDEDGAYLHIHLGRPASAAEMGDIAHVVRASVPAHVRFWRVYWGYDLRPVRLDSPHGLDFGMLDNDSGVWIPVADGEPVKASFGICKTASAPQPSGTAQALHTHTRSAKLTYDDMIQLDSWRLDSHVLVDAFGGIGELRRSITAAYQRTAPGPAQPGVAQITAAAWDGPLPTSATTHRTAQQQPAGLPQPRGWSGPWAGSTWRPLFIESKHSEST